MQCNLTYSFASCKLFFTCGHRLFIYFGCTESLLQQVDFSCCSAQAYCPAARGILVPWTGINPVLPPLKGRFLTAGPPGKSLGYRFSGVSFHDVSSYWWSLSRSISSPAVKNGAILIILFFPHLLADSFVSKSIPYKLCGYQW